MDTKYFREIFDYPIKDFRKHLEQPFNNRIIFSGRYGIGKTRFLIDFFDNEHQQSIFESVKYKVYRLSPVSYSIASNEDIFRFIKYDIIIEMLKSGTELQEIKLGIDSTIREYFKSNSLKVIVALVRMIPKVGKEIIECFKEIDKLKEEYLKFHDEINKSSGDKLLEYLDYIEFKEGSIYENDITTKIISDVIKRDFDFKSVLIIDDLDRLDPDHVFRILNVFAAHFDANDDTIFKNKFNFDKVILVCDINNLRNIFHHRYGSEVDFMGYIDKFYSNEIYYLNNKRAIDNIIFKILKSIEVEYEHPDDSNLIYQFYFGSMFVQNFLSLTISQGLVNLRSLIKLVGKKIDYHYMPISFDKNNQEIYPWKNPIMMQLKLLNEIFGGTNSFKNIVNRVIITDDFFENHNGKMANFLYLLSFKFHNYFPKNEYLFYFDNNPIILKIEFNHENKQFKRGDLYVWNGTYEKGIPMKEKEFSFAIPLFKKGMLETIALLHQVGYID